MQHFTVCWYVNTCLKTYVILLQVSSQADMSRYFTHDAQFTGFNAQSTAYVYNFLRKLIPFYH